MTAYIVAGVLTLVAALLLSGQWGVDGEWIDTSTGEVGTTSFGPRIAAVLILFAFLALLTGCAHKPLPAVASPVVELPDVSDAYGCPDKPQRPARPRPKAGEPRVKESAVAGYIVALDGAYGRLESAYDGCARNNSILSRTYEAARSRAIPPDGK